MLHAELFNIVLLGEGFPVGNVQAADFHMAGRPAREQIKIPILTQLQAGEFQIAVTPEQAIFGATNTTTTPDKVEAIAHAAGEFIDLYTSRRSVRAIGHNLRVAFGADELPLERFLHDIVASDSLVRQLGGDPLPGAEVTLNLRHGPATRVLAKLAGEPDGIVHLDLNFHFDVTGTLTAADVVALYPETIAAAEELVARTPHLARAEMTS